MTDADRIAAALAVIASYGGIDGAHHKQWVLDQAVRCLTGCPEEPVAVAGDDGRVYTYPVRRPSAEYEAWVAAHDRGPDGPDTYSWDEGTPP